MDFVETALWVLISSATTDASALAQEALRLFSVWERSPAVPKSSQFSVQGFLMRCALIDGLNGAREIITGRQAFQKHIRKQAVLITHLTPVLEVAFRINLIRYTNLGAKMDQLSADRLATCNSREDFQQWQNLLYIMSACANPDPVTSTEGYPAELENYLPREFQLQSQSDSKPRLQVKDMIHHFINGIVARFHSDNVHARESAKEALGNELNLKVMPPLFECLDA
jgi:hypothetical protein